jgi:hypothetical protein
MRGFQQRTMETEYASEYLLDYCTAEAADGSKVPCFSANLHAKRKVNRCWRSSTAEQLICNQQVAGSNPIASSRKIKGLAQFELTPFV